jgi:malonyl-CoA O-methyltransferase
MPVTARPIPGFDEQSDAARKRAIARSFDAAVRSYDSNARVQRRAARALATRIAELPLPAAPRILEVGCGTGFLSSSLMARFRDGRFLFTDLSPAMARASRSKLARRGDAGFAVMDGEAPAVAARFDLVASSFAMQWFLDLPKALAQLASCLRPGGQLAFATMGAESLREWRALHGEAGLAFGGLDFPSAAELSAMAEQARLRGTVTEERIKRRYADAATFLRELKALGAGTPGPGAAGLGAADMRRLLRRGGSGFTVTYHVLYGVFAAPR